MGLTVWSFLPPDRLVDPLNTGHVSTGSRVARLGTVSFVRSGFARVRWDDGGTSDEWLADLVTETQPEGE